VPAATAVLEWLDRLEQMAA
jgi:hypothetical protein